MADNKKSFIAYSDWKDTFDALPNDKAGELIKHIFAYVNDEDPITEDYLINAVFANIKNTLKRDLQKWGKQYEQRVKAGKKSAEVRKRNATSVNERSISSTVSVSVSDTVSVSEKKSINNNSFSKKCISDQQWLEVSAMQNKIKIDVIKLFISTFENHLITMEEQKKTLKDFKSHFINWLGKQNLSQFRVKRIGKTNQT